MTAFVVVVLVGALVAGLVQMEKRSNAAVSWREPTVPTGRWVVVARGMGGSEMGFARDLLDTNGIRVSVETSTMVARGATEGTARYALSVAPEDAAEARALLGAR